MSACRYCGKKLGASESCPHHAVHMEAVRQLTLKRERQKKPDPSGRSYCAQRESRTRTNVQE
jgi:hypothetical protein